MVVPVSRAGSLRCASGPRTINALRWSPRGVRPRRSAWDPQHRETGPRRSPGVSEHFPAMWAVPPYASSSSRIHDACDLREIHEMDRRRSVALAREDEAHRGSLMTIRGGHDQRTAMAVHTCCSADGELPQLDARCQAALGRAQPPRESSTQVRRQRLGRITKIADSACIRRHLCTWESDGSHLECHPAGSSH